MRKAGNRRAAGLRDLLGAIEVTKIRCRVEVEGLRGRVKAFDVSLRCAVDRAIDDQPDAIRCAVASKCCDALEVAVSRALKPCRNLISPVVGETQQTTVAGHTPQNRVWLALIGRLDNARLRDRLRPKRHVVGLVGVI
jgi:hypothetical protein